jgi:thiol-disulfide isomerase/thioredoxin
MFLPFIKSQEVYSVQDVLSGCLSKESKKCIKDTISISREEIPLELLQLGKPIEMSSIDFKRYIFDYTTIIEGNYTGNIPLIIEFYSKKCGPCKRLIYAYQSLAKEYQGKVLFYKINVLKEQEMAQKLGIQQLPTIILFSSKKEKPKAVIGAPSKSELQKLIEKELLKE